MDSANCRKLTLDDFSHVEIQYSRTQSWMGVPVDRKYINDNLQTAKDSYLSGADQNRILIGAFIDGELVVSCGIYFWEKLPFCSIMRLVSNGSEHFSFKKIERAYQSLFQFILDEMKIRRRNRFYILSNLAHQSGLALLTKKVPTIWKEYEMSIEEIISENQTPHFEYVWQMMGDRTWPTKLVLRSGTLKNEFRKFDENQSSEKIVRWWPNQSTL